MAAWAASSGMPASCGRLTRHSVPTVAIEMEGALERHHVSGTPGPRQSHPRLRLRTVLAFSFLFLWMSFDLGYPILNRYDPRKTPGLSDTVAYAALVVDPHPAEHAHPYFRILVPYVARPFYLLARGRLLSWDPVMFGLLMSDSLFTAATAGLLLWLGFRLTANYAVALGASLLFLLNFAVPNLRLAGLVDAGEGFFLLAVICALFSERYWWLPLLAALGAMTKESFVPLSVVLTATWLACSWRENPRRHMALVWVLSSWAVSLPSLMLVQRFISGEFQSPLQFALQLHHAAASPIQHLIGTLTDRNFWYVFGWLLPLAIPRLKYLPRIWLISAATMSMTALVMVEYYAAAPGTLGRVIFSIAGPLLSLSAAMLLFPAPQSEMFGARRA
jgi:hypothetical protein